MPLNQTFSCDDGGLYFLRQVGSDVFWFGEKKDRAFASVFVGTRSGSTVSGRFFTVPKGRLQAQGEITFTVSQNDTVLTRTAVTGNFAGTGWTACSVLPAAAKGSPPRLRAFPDPTGPPDDPELPDPEPISPCDLLRSPSTPVKAGFQATGPDDLTGTWRGNDGAFHYLRQAGNDLVWVAEKANLCQVFVGTRSGTTISGRRVDVPKAAGTGSGSVTYVLRSDANLGAGVMDLTSGSGSVRLSRYEQLDVRVRFDRLTVQATDERRGGGDEPFLWTAFIKVDGDTVDVSTVTTANILTELSTALGAASPLVVSTSGSHHNLSVRNNIEEGTQLAVPERVGQFATALRTITGLDPTFALDLPGFPEPRTARELTGLGFVAVAWEQDGFSDSTIEAGRQAMVDTLRTEIDREIAVGNLSDFSDLENKIAAAVEAAIRAATGVVLNPDDQIDFAFGQFSFAELLTSDGVIEQDLVFRGPEDHPARYRLQGSIRVT